MVNLDATTDVGLIQTRCIYYNDLFKRVPIVATVVIGRWPPTPWRAFPTRDEDDRWRLKTQSTDNTCQLGIILLSVNTGYGMFQNNFENTHTYTAMYCFSPTWWHPWKSRNCQSLIYFTNYSILNYRVCGLTVRLLPLKIGFEAGVIHFIMWFDR